MDVTLAGLPGLVGADLGRTAWIEVDQERIDSFAEATEDRQWIHVDRGRASTGPFGTTIAHGYLTLSFASAFLLELLVVTGRQLGHQLRARPGPLPGPGPGRREGPRPRRGGRRLLPGIRDPSHVPPHGRVRPDLAAGGHRGGADALPGRETRDAASLHRHAPAASSRDGPALTAGPGNVNDPNDYLDVQVSD